MSAARSTRSTGTRRSSASRQETTAPMTQTITLPSLQAMFSPVLNSTNAANQPCNCGCCQTSTTVCLTFDTTWLQNLVNMFPKVNITNNNTCADEDCGCEDEDEPVAGK